VSGQRKPEPLDAPLFKAQPQRGFREDWERSRNAEGTVPTKEAHYWIAHPMPQFGGACTAHAACGLWLHYDADRRLVNRDETPLCSGCGEWAAQRIAAGHDMEREIV